MPAITKRWLLNIVRVEYIGVYNIDVWCLKLEWQNHWIELKNSEPLCRMSKNWRKIRVRPLGVDKNKFIVRSVPDNRYLWVILDQNNKILNLEWDVQWFDDTIHLISLYASCKKSRF